MENAEKPTTKRTKPTVERGKGSEAQRVNKRLEGFDHMNCTAFLGIRKWFSCGITNNELKSMARVLCSKIDGLQLDRDATRDNRVLIKWYDENWSIIEPNLKYIQLRDEGGSVIDPSRDGNVPSAGPLALQ